MMHAGSTRVIDTVDGPHGLALRPDVPVCCLSHVSTRLARIVLACVSVMEQVMIVVLIIFINVMI